MESFWNGFEKQAGVKDVIRGASGKAKNAGNAVKAWWNRSGVYDNVRKTTAHAEEAASTAKGHAARAGESGARAAEHAETSMKNVADMSKYIKPAGAALGTAYVGSKLLEAPARYQQYKYYKNQNAEKRAAEYSQQQIENALEAKAREKKKSGFLGTGLKGTAAGGLLGLGLAGAIAVAEAKNGFHANSEGLIAAGRLGALGGAALGGLKGIANRNHNAKVNRSRDALLTQEGPERTKKIMSMSPDRFWSPMSRSEFSDLSFQR